MCMLADLLASRLTALQEASRKGEELLEVLANNVAKEQDNLRAVFELNNKKLDQYHKMKRVLIEASLSELSADIFRTESLLTAVDVVDETQEISVRPIPSIQITVGDVPQFPTSRELKLAQSLAKKEPEISDLRRQMQSVNPVKQTAVQKTSTSLFYSSTRAALVAAIPDIFATAALPVSRVEFFSRLRSRDFSAQDIDALMLKGSDENGDVWPNRII